jgi:putative ABC transport system permease protein
MAGVVRAEGVRIVPERLRAGHRTERVAITGLPAERDLLRLLGAADAPVALPREGLVVSESLGRRLGLEIGDLAVIEVLEGERPVRRAPVAGFVTNYTGAAAYMDARALNRMMREGERVSGAFLAVDRRARDELYAELKSTPAVGAVTIKSAAIESFRRTIAENLLRMRAFNILFASIIAFGVVYNSARISLSERSRDLATLRVIGFTRGEVSLILLGELAVLTLAAIPVGLAMGTGFAWLMVSALQSRDYRFPLVIEPSTYAFAIAVTLAAAAISGLVVRRRVDRLDLVEVLKTKV